MATECEDLRLSLSLCSSSHNNLPLNLTLPVKTQYVDLEAEEDARAWSPVSTLSCLSGKRSKRDDNEGEEDGQLNSGKKLRLSKAQITILEQGFNEHNTLSTKHKQALARHLNLRPRQVEVWFQNRRARTKLKQTEVEYEYLKRWFQNLAEENKRLQKEASELRKLKLAPPKLQFLASPPSTLTMCPSCERTAISNTGSSKTITPSSPPLQLLPGSHQNLWASYLFNRAS